MEQKTDKETFLQVVMLVSGIVRRINAKRLDKVGIERLNKRLSEQCADSGKQES